MEIRDVYALLGRTAYGADGDRLGTVSGAYLDNVTRRPSWLTVERGGLFRTTRSFVPVEGVELVDDGVRVAVDGEAVKRAPHIEGDRELSAAEEQELRAHYGLAGAGASAQEHAPTEPEPEPDVSARDVSPSAPAASAAPEQAAMIRSEEQARVATETVPASRAVLRTTRIVEDRTFSVPLGRDQVQVAYEPLPDSGPAPVTAQEQRPQGSPQAEHRSSTDADDRAGSSSTRSGSSSAPSGFRSSGCGFGPPASRARRSCRSTCGVSASTSTSSTPRTPRPLHPETGREARTRTRRTGPSLNRWLSSVRTSTPPTRWRTPRRSGRRPSSSSSATPRGGRRRRRTRTRRTSRRPRSGSTSTRRTWSTWRARTTGSGSRAARSSRSRQPPRPPSARRA